MREKNMKKSKHHYLNRTRETRMVKAMIGGIRALFTGRMISDKG